MVVGAGSVFVESGNEKMLTFQLAFFDKLIGKNWYLSINKFLNSDKIVGKMLN